MERTYEWYTCGECDKKLNHPRELTFTPTTVLHLADSGECTKTQDIPSEARLSTAKLECDVQATLEQVESGKARDKKTSKTSDKTVTDTKDAWSHRTNNPNAFKKRS